MAAPILEYSAGDPTADRPTPYAWAVVLLLSVVAALNYLDRLMITHMSKPLMADLKIGAETFGLFTSVFLFSYALCSPLGGFLADRVGKRKVIITSLLFWSLATAVSGHAHTAGHLIAARILMGVSEACYIPAALALISDYHRGSTRSLATGIHMVGLYIGSSIGALSGYIAANYGWRFGFQFFGWFGVAYFILLFFTLRDAPKTADANVARVERPQFGPAFAALFSRTSFYILLAINVLVGIANWVVNGWLPSFLDDRFKAIFNPGDASAKTIYIQVASFVGVLLAGAWADRWSRTYPKARAIVPAVGWILAGPALIGVALSGMLPLTIVCLIIFGLGRGAFDANQMPIVREVVPEKYSATAYGFLNMIGTTFGGLAIWMGGRLKDAKVDSSIMFTVGGGSLVLVAVLLMTIRTRRSAHDDGTLLPPDELAAATITETGSVPAGAMNTK